MGLVGKNYFSKTKEQANMQTAKKVLIANGQGFWGDSILGPTRLVKEGTIDYLTLDYLAEVTMSILQKQRKKNSQVGYATDFIELLRKILPDCAAKGIRIIANAGGVNPLACGEAARKVADEFGLSNVRIFVVTGDDIKDRLSGLVELGELMCNLDSGESIAPIFDRIQSANVYIGAKPIVNALEDGADIVITGRASDPSLVLAPLIKEFGWAFDDYDKMASGTVAGHILECGAQCSGGNYTYWENVKDFVRIGYPVAEVSSDGSFIITKHADTGGLINRQTVISQLVYEMGNPEEYLGPDCIADFSSIEIVEEAENRVRLFNIKGYKPTPTYKVSIAYHDGYKIVSQLVVAGPQAKQKAELCAKIVFGRASLLGVHIAEEDQFVELLGTNVCHQGILPSVLDPGEIVLRIGAKGCNREALDQLGREVVPLVTSGPPGVTGFAGGRPRATEVIGYWPALVSKHVVDSNILIQEVRL
jgi:hypothetical protein